MGRVRERPRLVAAQVLAILVVAGAGVLIGMALADEEPTVPAATQVRLDRAERQVARNERELGALNSEVKRGRRSASRVQRRARALVSENRRLRRTLRRTRRALRRARQ